MTPATVRHIPYLISWMALPILLTPLWLSPAHAQKKPSESGETRQSQEEIEILEIDDAGDTLEMLELDSTDPTNPEELRPLNLDSSVLSLSGAQRSIEDARTMVTAGDYEAAALKLQEARQVLNQLSNYHQELAASFSGIDNRIFENHRDMALQAAQLRDRATYELAILHRAQNRPELAVPLLVQIIRSQNPTRELGQNSYRQLFELGFVDSPYPRPRENAQSN